MQKVIAKISLNAIACNAQIWKKQAGTRLYAVIKANAYGHGAEEVANALSGIADGFAVALLEEGLSVRGAACGKDILVLTPPIGEEECYAMAASGLVASIPDLSTAREFIETCRRYRLIGRVHLKVNTGMNRYGMDGEELNAACSLCKEAPFVKVEGLYSHLYTCNREIAETQRQRFLRLQAIAKGYFPTLRSHLSATYGALLGKQFAFDGVRIGLGLYGYTPVETSLPLTRAMSVWGRVTATRSYEYGGAGYGELTLQKGTPLTLLRVGYADGLLRNKANGAFGYEENANNLCMDGCIRIGEGERGTWVPVMTDAAQTARITGTIPYEVLCAATRRATFMYEE